MDEHVYHLELAGARWCVRSPQALQVPESCAPFLLPPCEADCTIAFAPGHPAQMGTLVQERAPRVWACEDGWMVERTLAVLSHPSGCVHLTREAESTVRGWLYPERADDIRNLDQLIDISELEILLSRMDATSLHSSMILHRGEVVLFTAPSGTGKSTQADLWAAHRGAEILNGDRSILRRHDGRWHAYGSPFAGSSSIYRNEHAPVRAIVVLRQAPENTIRALPAAEAFRDIYSETVLPRWNTLAHEHVINLVSRITAEVPVWLLACTPDERAVQLLEQTIWR